MLAGIAQSELNLISERVKSGLAAARARGRKLVRQAGLLPSSARSSARPRGVVPDGAVAAVTAALGASQARRGAQELPPSGRHCVGYVWSPTPKAPAFVYGERAALSRRISAIAWLTSRAILARASNAATICASFFSRVSPRAVSSSRTNSLISLAKLV